jgi:hypothetical protein
MTEDTWTEVHKDVHPLPDDKKNVLISINYDEEVHIAYRSKGKWFAVVDDNLEVMGDAYINNEISEAHGLVVIGWRHLPKHAKFRQL